MAGRSNEPTNVMKNSSYLQKKVFRVEKGYEVIWLHHKSELLVDEPF